MTRSLKREEPNYTWSEKHRALSLWKDEPVINKEINGIFIQNFQIFNEQFLF